MYKVWVMLNDGQKINFVNLSENQAIKLYNQMRNKIEVVNVKSLGWSKM
jgi:hypothetical protein